MNSNAINPALLTVALLNDIALYDVRKYRESLAEHPLGFLLQHADAPFDCQQCNDLHTAKNFIDATTTVLDSLSDFIEDARCGIAENPERMEKIRDAWAGSMLSLFAVGNLLQLNTAQAIQKQFNAIREKNDDPLRLNDLSQLVRRQPEGEEARSLREAVERAGERRRAEERDSCGHVRHGAGAGYQREPEHDDPNCDGRLSPNAQRLEHD